MAASRVPGPIREAATRRNDSFVGLEGGGSVPGPIGSELLPDEPLPADSKDDKSDTSVEVNLVGKFPRPSSWTDAKEKSLIAAGSWFPHTADFKGVAGTQSIEVADAWDFLLKIIEAKSSIRRLNFFSHAKTGLVAMEGTIAEDGSSVSLAPSGANAKWTQIFSTKAIVDPYGGTWGSSGEDSGSIQVKVGTKSFSLDDVRRKFTKEAVIWLYLCNGATDPMLHQNIANTFQTTVKAFTPEIVYCAPSDFPQSRKHKVTPLTTQKHIDSCPNAVADFRQLDGHGTVRTMKPKK
jgi:hypothetical protein